MLQAYHKLSCFYHSSFSIHWINSVRESKICFSCAKDSWAYNYHVPFSIREWINMLVQFTHLHLLASQCLEFVRKFLISFFSCHKNSGSYTKARAISSRYHRCCSMPGSSKLIIRSIKCPSRVQQSY